jgi:hypothetical protein
MRRRSSTDTAIGAVLSALSDIRPRACFYVSVQTRSRVKHLPELVLDPVLALGLNRGGPT